jgi:hypothetical protein
MRSILAFHTVILYEIKQVRRSAAVDAFVGCLVKERFITWTGRFARVRNLSFDLLKVPVVVNVFSGIDVRLVFLLAGLVKALAGWLFEVKSFVALSAIVFVEIPEKWQFASFALGSIKVPFVGGTFRVLAFVIGHFTDKVFSIDHVAVVSVVANECVSLTLSGITWKRVTIFADFALAWLEVPVPGFFTAEAFFTIWEGFFLGTFDNWLGFEVRLVRGDGSVVIVGSTG